MHGLVNSLKARLALFFGLAVCAVGLPTYLYIDQVYSRQLRDDQLQALQSHAVSVAAVLSENLRERQREISLLAEAPYLKLGAIEPAVFQPVLDWLQASYPLYAWIGFTDLSGKVVVSTNGLLVGGDVSKRPWFIAGQKGQYVGDLHEALLLSKLLPPPADGEPLRFLDFAAPVYDANGRLRGVLAAHAHWAWAAHATSVLRNKGREGEAIEVIIADHAGTLIYPQAAGAAVAVPAAVLAGTASTDDWGGPVTYAHAVAAVAEPVAGSALAWKVVVRRPVDSIFADLVRLKLTLATVVLVATLLLMLAIAWLAARFSRPVEQLARFAQRIEAGDENVELANDAQTVEVRQAIDSVKQIARVLIERKQALLAANRDLEHKVAERTAELLEHKKDLEDRVLERTRELAAARDKAEAANRAKTYILANMSHELRTPLNHIVGMNTLLKREVTSPRGLDRVDKIGQASQTLLRLITNLLDTVHAETAQLEIVGIDFDLAALVAKVEANCLPAAAEKGLAVNWVIAAGVPDRLHGDEQRLAQVLSELVDNAIKFSDATPVVVRISVSQSVGSSLITRFEIEDHGIGIPPDIQAHVFDLFSQGDPSTTRKYGGLGLGLLLCQRLVHLMAGEIGFTAQAERGSIFWIEIPLRVGAPRAPGQASDPAQSWSSVGQELALLIVQLEEGDFAVGATWAALAPRVGHLLDPQRAAFESAIADYDFDAALAIL
ncbi:MAG: hypothetical protein RL299_1403, partial [Pseudomonadota bacterium]